MQLTTVVKRVEFWFNEQFGWFFTNGNKYDDQQL